MTFSPQLNKPHKPQCEQRGTPKALVTTNNYTLTFSTIIHVCTHRNYMEYTKRIDLHHPTTSNSRQLSIQSLTSSCMNYIGHSKTPTHIEIEYNSQN